MRAIEQGAPCQALASATVPQRSYVQLNVPAFEQRVYLYAPDIKSSFGGGFSAFTLWIVEGVYGKPFVQPTGSMDESAFEQIRTSRNVMATPASRQNGPCERRSRSGAAAHARPGEGQHVAGRHG
jgi:hypothetical protein